MPGTDEQRRAVLESLLNADDLAENLAYQKRELARLAAIAPACGQCKQPMAPNLDTERFECRACRRSERFR
jgi:hypothetical protein